jgi:outer membrane lipoprotein-sorting protein
VDRTNYVAYYQGVDGRAKITMAVTDRQGRKRTKEMIILRQDASGPQVEDLQPSAEKAKRQAAQKADQAATGEQKFYVYFLSPPDDNKTTFLVWKHLDKDDDRWLYQPNLDLVNRIAGSDKRTSFVGSHFFYEDVSGRNVADDEHKLVQTTADYYVLRNTPKKPDTVEFAYYDMYIARDTFLPVHIWYYDSSGRKYRMYKVDKWTRDPTYGYIKIEQATMTDENIGGTTVLTYDDVEFNIKLPEKLFTDRYLKRPPYTFLKK